MKHIRMYMMKAAPAVLSIVVLFSCSKDPAPGNNNPPSTALQVTSVTPLTGGYNTTVTIAGKNFNPNPSLDTVLFNGKAATVLSATTDTLKVSVPLAAGTGAIQVRASGQAVTSGVFNYQSAFIVTTVAGNGIDDGFNGASTVSPVHNPVGVIVDAQGNIYYSEYNRIRKISASGVITTIAGAGSRGFQDGPGASALFSPTTGITMDPSGNIYVADRDNERIRKIDLSGNVTTYAGSATYGYQDGPIATALFWEPVDVASDAQGNIFVADRSNARVRKISPSGTVSTVAGDGTFGYQDGPALSAKFRNIAGIATDAQGNVYVAEETGNRIRKITPAGMVTTLAGSGINSFADGPALSSDFADPLDIAADNQGNIFVADQTNQVIRKISVSGTVTTIAGTPVVHGFRDGAASQALFYYPQSVAVDAQGNVFVADRANHRIRKIANQ